MREGNGFGSAFVLGKEDLAMRCETIRRQPGAARRHVPRALGLVAAFWLMSGCAETVAWQKPGADDSTAKLDLAYCRHQAERVEIANSGDLDEPFGAGPGSVSTLTGAAEYPGEYNPSAAQVHGILAKCMEARGYQPVAPKQKAS
jgi:hypothetical protein